MAAITHNLRLNNTCTFDDCLLGSVLKTLAHGRTKELPVVSVYDTIGAVPFGPEALGEHSSELSPEHFALLEKTLPDTAHRYAVITRNGKPALFAYYQLFTLTPANFNLESNNTFTKGLIKFFIKVKRTKILMLGNALENEKKCYCYDPAMLTSDEATEAVAALAEKIAADDCTSAIILKELPELSGNTQRILDSSGYIQPFEDRVMEMQVDANWTTFADYLNDLSRKYKARANKIVAALNGVEVRMLTIDETRQCESRIHELFSATIHQQPFTLTHPAKGFFTGLKELYKDDFELWGYFKDGRMIGFYSAFVKQHSYNIYYIGFDYQENNTHQLYFNILFAGLDRAIQLQKRVLELGRTSFDAKASLGAKDRKLTYAMKLEYIPDFITKRFVSYFSDMENSHWKQRNPLKTAAATA